MKDLRDKLQEISWDLYLQQDKLDQEKDIDYWTLQEEINDIIYMLLHIDSSARRGNKLSAIEAINNKTTSGTVYDTVNEYISNNNKMKNVKLGLGIGIGVAVGIVMYRKNKKSKKKVIQ